MRPSSAQEQYFFSDEFNENRGNNTLDSGKWNYYPNTLGCVLATIKEAGGSVLLQQCNNKPQFPYFYSKINSFPDGDFSAEIKFQYTKATHWGTGFALVDKAPENGAGFNYLFGIGLWQDKSSGTNMRISYDGTDVFSKAINIDPHIFRIDKVSQVYQIFFDGNLVFTSPQTQETVKAIWFGNPDHLSFNIPEWTNFKVDYVRVKQLIPEGPVPFLDLPWDYGANGMTFNEAAASINAYFDHEYPLLSTSLTEPVNTFEDLVNYEGIKDKRFPYSKHDGYDYGAPAKTKLNTPLLAPADGEAEFINSCAPCGNAILIDHKNGYQTRYYHLQPDGLITNQPGQKVNVTKGQQIGKVGFSGNVSPSGETGSHLHFMVIQDKNNDGNFEDNIPDGIVDPFGWQSTGPDPWENYSFSYGGQNRTGSKSYYLFTKKLDNLNANLTSNAGVFNVGKTTLDFPQGSTNQNLNLSIISAPNFTDLLGLNSLGSIISVEAKNTAGQIITTFLKNFVLTINFSQFDLSRFDLNTLSIYSSPNGQDWTIEPTQIDLNNNTAAASINHLTYFALMATRRDTTAPVTSAVLEGEKGGGNNFRSDVSVNLSAIDNEGGLGVEYTAYRIPGEDFQTYTAPLLFSNEGTHKIEFYSQDNDGNVEVVKSVELSIDKTPPEAKVFIDLDLLDLKVEGIDNAQTLVEKKDNPETGKKDDAVYVIKDPSGNTLTLDVRDRVKEKQDLFGIHFLQYNSGPPQILDQNKFDVSYKGKKEKLNVKEQNFKLKEEVKIRIQYDSKKDLSTIITQEAGLEKVKETLNGLTLLQLVTNKGKLEYSY